MLVLGFAWTHSLKVRVRVSVSSGRVLVVVGLGLVLGFAWRDSLKVRG